MKPIGNAPAFFRQNFSDPSPVSSRCWGLLFLWLAAMPLRVLADCQSTPTGLIGWWPGDGNANNVLGTNNGTLQGGATASAAGWVGNGFTFDGTNGSVQVPNSPLLQPTNLTIEAWVKFNSLDSSAGTSSSPAGDQYIVFKQNTRSTDFEGFDLSKTRVGGSDYFRFLVASASGQGAQVLSSSTISTGVWYHVAAVRGSNFLQLYVNGSLQRQTNVTFAQSYGTQPLYFGTSGQPAWDHKLKGNLDEVSLYNRALSSNEIAAIYFAGAAGKCKAPNITLQPQAQVVVAGNNAIFTTAATGFGTLRYQWQLNGSPLAGATNASLTLINVQLANQGFYSVTVSNLLGSTLSASASLVVGAPQPGVPYISTFSPAKAAPGSILNISGFNFSPVAASNVVYFGAVRANVLTASATNLTVTVPVGATFAPPSVTVTGLTAMAQSPFLPSFVGSGSNITATSFDPGQNLSAAAGPIKTVIADLDGDGKPDLVEMNTYAHTTSLFRNIGPAGILNASSFAARVDLPSLGGTDSPRSITAADVDGDGKLDLLVPNGPFNTVVIYRNISTPGSLTTESFAAPVSLNVGTDPRAVHVGDLDGDGRPEIIVANYGGNSLSLFQNIGAPGSLTTGSFAPKYELVVGGNPADVAIADLNNDGRPDLAVLVVAESKLAIWRNTAVVGGNISNWFSLDTSVPTLSGCNEIVPGDMDGDGKLDLAVASVQGNAVSVFRNLAAPAMFPTNTFAAGVDFGTPGWAHSVAVGDFNGDGKPDLAVVGELGSYLAVFQNQSMPGSFTAGSLAARVDFATGWNAWGVAVGDLDGDGRADIVFANSYDNNLTLYRNTVPFSGPPFVLAHPASQSATEGNSTIFTVTADGPTPLNYQWRYNGVALTNNARVSGAQTNVLTIANLVLVDAGNYTVVITNSFGSVTSVVAVLTVNPAVCSAPASGLVGWWTGDGQAFDSANTNHGVLLNGASFAPGRIGQAFSFDGVDDRVTATGAPALNFGINADFSIETWIKAFPSATDSVIMSIVGKRQSPNYFTALGYELFLVDGKLACQIAPASQGIANFTSSSANLQDGIFHHVALTMERQSVTGGKLYVDGQLVLTFDPTAVNGDLSSPEPLRIGNHPDPALNFFFKGLIDEVSIYNRALAAGEIVAIYNSSTAGKCPLPPAFVQAPQSRTSFAGQSTTFTAVASGTPPLAYQWQLNGTNIAGATNATLTLTNLQFSQQGNYAVVVSNAVTAIISSNAVLGIIPPPPVPYLSAFNPPAALGGMTVMLSGSNFSATVSNNIVYFGAVRANVITASPTSLTVTVPSGATYAPITVTVDGLTGSARTAFLPTFVGNGQAVSASTFSARQDLTVDYGNYQSVIADFDGDGKPDLGVGNGNSHIISLFQNLSTPGSNVFAPRVILPIVDSSASPVGFISADIDGDGRMDLLFTDIGNGRVGIMRNISVPGTLTTNSFAPPVYFAAGSVCFRVRVQDLDGDGRPDVVVCNQGSSTLSVLRNLGISGDLTTNSFAPAFSLATGASPNEFCIQDLDGDGKPDLAVANDQSSFVSLFRNVSVPGELKPESFAPAINLPTYSGQLIVNAGDVDGDGRPELLVGGRANVLSVFRNLGLGTLTTNSFAASVDFSMTGWVHNVVLGDINGDGKPDPVVVGELGSYLAVFQNQSSPGSFTAGSLAARVDFGTGWNAWGVSVGDLDGDGRPDVAFCNNYETFASLYRNVTPFGSPPVILGQPSNQVATVGNLAAFAVTISNATTANYQWYFNGAALDDTARIIGTKTKALTIANVLPADAGDYTVVVTNFLGGVTSTVATLTVNPAMCVSPEVGLLGWWGGEDNAMDSAGVNHGALLNGTAFGVGKVGRAFSFDGVNDLVIISNVPALNPTNGLTVEAWVYVPNYPGNDVVLIGKDDANSARQYELGLGNVSGQWRFRAQVGTAGGFQILNGTAPVQLQVWYHVVMTYDGSALRLTVNGSPDGSLAVTGPIVSTSQPLLIGGIISGPWNFNGLIDEVSIYNRALSLSEIQSNHNASMLGKCAVPPSFLSAVPNLLTVPGGTVVSVAPLTGSQPMTQQWYFNGLPLIDGVRISGSTSNVLSLSNTSTNDVGSYFVVASNAVGVSTSSVAQLILGFPPVVVQSPMDQTNITGLNALFTVAATGDPVLGYQWRFNGNNLTNNTHFGGAGSASLAISNLVVGDAGNYDVIVTNGFGSVTSAVAVLTLLQAPTFTAQPVSRLIVPGLPTTFSATVTGPAPLTYQWQFNGADILDATNTTYTIASVNVTNLGNYRLVASNSIAVRASADAVLALGNIAAWGRNDIGQTVVPLSATNVIALSSGITSFNTDHTLALRADGTVIAWGNNSNGQTNVPATLSNVVAIAAGGTHSLALRANGTVVAWGNNGNGQLNVPATLSNVIAIAAGGAHSLALRADGRVIAWGYNVYGQSTPPTNLNKVVAIAAGLNHSIALRSDGVAINWGFSSDRIQGAGPATVTLPLADVAGIAGGNSHSLFLRTNGTVFAIGSNTYGQTNPPPSLTNATAVAAGDYYSMALRANGTVAVWGRNEYTQTNVPPGVSNVVAITAGGTDAYALLSDGRPLITPPVGGVDYVGRDHTFRAGVSGTAPLSLQWQFNDADIPGATNTTLVLSGLTLTNTGNFRLVASNALGVATSVVVPLVVLDQTNLLMLSQLPTVQTNYLGDKVVLTTAVTGNGPVQYQWKFNGADIVGATNQDLVFDPILLANAGNYVVAISNQSSGLVSLTSTQRVTMVRVWGYLSDPTYASAAPPTLTNAVAVAAGYAGYGNSFGHYLALRADGKITMWMSAQSSTAITNIPASVTNATVTAIAGGLNSSIALRSDGTPVTWGSNTYSQSNTPASAFGVTAIAAGDNHFLALRSDGTVVTWGITTAGLMNVPASATNIVAIAAGTTHSLALRGNGTVVAWGLGTAGQTNVPVTLTNAIAISAGNQFSAALRADGTVVQWGNGLANYPAPTGLSNIVAIAAGYNHLLALRADGTLVSWGYYYSGSKDQITPGDLANIIQISANGDRDVALLGARTPAITIQPYDRALLRGSNTTFIARAVSPVAASYQWRLNGADIPFATNATLNLTNVQLAQAGAYQLVVSNSYGIAVTRNAKLTVTLPLAEVLDTTNVTWLSTNTIPWFGQAGVSHDGVDAARSGSITHSQETLLQTTLNGPAQFSFWWKASSEAGFDTLEFRLDGVTQATISGEADWEQRSYAIAPGAHTLLWRYAKDASSSGGQDAGWVDQFIYTPNAPVITLQPVGTTVNVGSNVSFSVTATGVTPFTYQWLRNGTNAGFANSSTLALNSVGRSARGVYSVLVANSGGGALSSNAVLSVLVPQQFGAGAIGANGRVLFTSGDVDGGVLTATDLAAFEAQASTNLTDWVTLPNALSVTNGLLLLQDPTQTNYPARFYRVLEH